MTKIQNDVIISKDESNELFESVISYCQQLIACPDVIEFKEIRKVVTEQAIEMKIQLPQSYQHNLLRKVKQTFLSLNFIH